jgi:hypothetical protein
LTQRVLDPRALGRATLARQLLLAREPLAPLAAIERLVGLQAQLARPPFIGLWTRLAGFERAALHRLLHDRRAVRATFLRGTLHIVSAADYLALRPALRPVLEAAMRSILDQRARGAPLDLAALAAFARTQLPATFDQLRPLLAKQFPDIDERALGYAVRMHLPVVQVPGDDPWSFPGAAAFADAEAWLGQRSGRAAAAAATAAATDALVRRYLAAFGPATVRDAQRWSGLPDLKPAFERLRPSLVTFRDDRKRELFDLPDAPRPPPDAPAPVRFVPDFDNLVLGHDDRRRVIADEHRPRLTTKNLQVKATFLVDGFAAGTWKIERAKQAATLMLSPFGKLARAARAALEEEGSALLAFVEPDVARRAIRVAAP